MCSKSVNCSIDIERLIICSALGMCCLISRGIAFEGLYIWAASVILAYIGIEDIRTGIIRNRNIVTLIALWAFRYMMFLGSKPGNAIAVSGAAGVSTSSGYYGAGRLLTGIMISGTIYLVAKIIGMVLGKKVLGGGDIKLIGAMGLYLGFSKSLYMLLLACILGLLTVIISRNTLTGNKGIWAFRKGYIPFGPAIAAASIAMLFAAV